MQIFYLLILTVQAAQCNGTASEIPVGYELQISHATRTVGIVLEQIFTNDAIYISTGDGEWYKFFWNASLAWATDFGDKGRAMALSTDSTFLVATHWTSNVAYLGKINSSDGVVMESYKTDSVSSYFYMFIQDSRALCINRAGWF